MAVVIRDEKHRIAKACVAFCTINFMHLTVTIQTGMFVIFTRVLMPSITLSGTAPCLSVPYRAEPLLMTPCKYGGHPGIFS